MIKNNKIENQYTLIDRIGEFLRYAPFSHPVYVTEEVSCQHL